MTPITTGLKVGLAKSGALTDMTPKLRNGILRSKTRRRDSTFRFASKPPEMRRGKFANP